MRHPLARAIPVFSAEPEPQEFVSIRGKVRSANEGNGRSTVELRPSLHILYFRLEGVSEAEIDLDKIFHSGIEVVIPAADPIIVGLTEDSNMGSKPIFKSAADVP